MLNAKADKSSVEKAQRIRRDQKKRAVDAVVAIELEHALGKAKAMFNAHYEIIQ